MTRAAAPDSPYLRPASGEQDPLGILFLDAEQVYQFRARPARRLRVAAPAGKPSVIRMPGAELLTAYTRDYVADLARARQCFAEMRWSSDEGETWSEAVQPFPGVPGTKEATPVPLADGRVLCLVHSGQRAVHTPLATMSEDQGRTWAPPWELDVSAMFRGNRALANRTHVPLDDGSVILFLSDFSTAPPQTWAGLSRDGGRGLQECWHVGDHIGDQSFLRLPSGRILGALRVLGEGIPDRGLLPYGHVPAQLLRLDDGCVLLTYGVRQYPMGAQALLSADEGRTWDQDGRLMLAWHGAPYCGSLPDWGRPYSNGHPFSAQRLDGRVLTLYCRTADPAQWDSTVVEGVIWDVPEA